MHIYDVCLDVLVSLCTGSRDDAMMRCRQFFFCQWVAIRCCVLQDNAKCCSVIWPTDASVRCSTLQHAAAHCNTLQHTATRCSTLQHAATRCNTLQHIATCCNILQHTVTHSGDCMMREHVISQTAIQWSHDITLQHTATSCNTLPHTGTHCKSLQCTTATRQLHEAKARDRTQQQNVQTVTHCSTM